MYIINRQEFFDFERTNCMNKKNYKISKYTHSLHWLPDITYAL